MDVDSLRATITRQGALVRELKQKGGDADELVEAVNKLKALKLELEQHTVEESVVDIKKRKAMEDLLVRKMYVVPSFEIYGGVGGFYDFGPSSCALKANLLTEWRKHFIMADSMLEVECTNLMPEIVLQTSGHVDKFTDLMVKDVKSGECHRADKLLEDHIENLLATKGSSMSNEEQEEHRLVGVRAESMSPEEIHSTFQKYGIKSPGTGNDLSSPVPFNLMFSCAIGPEGGQVGYLRPETAQGIFINFRRLLEYNAGKMPFAVAQVGNAFRNEISPRGGLLRVREFQQAEIEHFVHPENKQHSKFDQVANDVLVLFPKSNQLSDGKCVEMTVGDAVAQQIINNETLGYFIARTARWVRHIGIDQTKVRFRQHLDTEMAHYATDCWDLEIFMSGSWIECAGHADRSCFDLKVHAKKSKVEMVGTLKYDKPRQIEEIEMKANKGILGRQFKSESSIVNEALDELRLKREDALHFEKSLAENGSAELGPLCNGKTYTIERPMVNFKLVTKTRNEEKFVPSVIEPSFGVGRILNAVFEHSFYVRPDDENRVVMAFRPIIAPIKASILPLSANAAFDPFIQELEKLLIQAHISSKTDTSSVAIGRKYARADELGIPFNITVDFETISTQTVTLRERDSCQQIRLPLKNVAEELNTLISDAKTWDDMIKNYPLVRGDETGEATIVETTTRGRFRRPARPVTEAPPTKGPKPVKPAEKQSFVSTAPVVDEEAVLKCKEAIVAQGDKIRVLKTEGVSKEELKPSIDELLALKQKYKQLSGEEYVAPNQGSSKKKKKNKA